MNTQTPADVHAPITRSEVADAVGAAFGMGGVSRAALVDVAARAGARTEVLTALQRLPERDFSDLRQLWADLPEMPVR